MSSLADGLNIASWLTKRIDQFSAWAKKKGRQNEVRKIDVVVDAHDNTAVDRIVRNISKNREERTNAS